MFPIAWAIVDVESTESWEWFITLLKDDLNLDNGFGYTLMTDQHKGLKNAIDNILPGAEHRCCARHIHANWKKNHPGNVLKNMFWQAAKANTIEARYKPILELLDDIRLKVMERLHVKRDLMMNNDCRICPQIIKKLNFSIKATKFCKSTWTGADECEVKDIDGGQWVVNMVQRTCSCRRWELRGYPCSHGCTALFSIDDKPEDKIHECYSRSVYMKTYENMLKPMKGPLYWPKTGLPDILPPKARRMPGRPKKNKRMEQGEPGAGVKLGEKGIRMKCIQCLMYGHNKSGCKTSKEEILVRQREAAEAKKAQAEAAKAQVAERKKKVTSQKKKPTNVGDEATNAAQQPKRKRGRPPKAENVEVLPPPPPLPPPGVGVWISKDGHTYFSTTRETIRVSSSQPAAQTSKSSTTRGKKSSIQP